MTLLCLVASLLSVSSSDQANKRGLALRLPPFDASSQEAKGLVCSPRPRLQQWWAIRHPTAPVDQPVLPHQLCSQWQCEHCRAITGRKPEAVRHHRQLLAMLKLWAWQRKRPPQGIEAQRTLPTSEGDRGPLGLSPHSIRNRISGTVALDQFG